MEPRELLDDIRQLLVETEKEGINVVYIDPFKKYLDALEKDASDTHELRRRMHESSLAYYNADSQHNLEMFKSVLDAGKSALQSLILINGGAVVALLGVFSSLATQPNARALAHAFALPLLQFGIGVLLGAVGFAFRYLSQAQYGEHTEQDKRAQVWGDRFKYASIVSAGLGFLSFMLGVGNAYIAVSRYFAP